MKQRNIGETKRNIGETKWNIGETEINIGILVYGGDMPVPEKVGILMYRGIRSMPVFEKLVGLCMEDTCPYTLQSWWPCVRRTYARA